MRRTYEDHMLAAAGLLLGACMWLANAQPAAAPQAQLTAPVIRHSQGQLYVHAVGTTASYPVFYSNTNLTHLELTHE